MTAAPEVRQLASGGMVLCRADHARLAEVVELQQAAYARNRVMLGLEPLPLLADYEEIFATMEVWIAEDAGRIQAALILEPQPDYMLLWSISTRPGAQGKGLGRKLLAAADVRARELGLDTIRLYTGATLEHLVTWYQRHGYQLERIEQLTDRQVAHLIKHLEET